MGRSFERQLDDLLGEDITATQIRVHSAFNQLSAPFEKKLVLFGAGNLGRRTLARLRQIGIEPLAFSDNNHLLWNSTIEGVRVYSPLDAVEKFGKIAIFVLTILSDKFGHPLNIIQNQLNFYGPARVVSFAFLYWKYAEAFLPYFCLDLPYILLGQSEKIRAAAQMWADDASRAEYLAQVRWRLHLNFDGLPKPVSHRPYFPIDLYSLGGKTVFVDCGAFDGDTIRDFLEQQGSNFNQIFAIEPDKTNFAKLESYISALPTAVSEKIKLYQLAVGERKEKVHFEAAGTMESVVSESGSTEVESVPLDELLAGTLPTCVKMDIEGAEPEALLGMQNTIKEVSPMLAISVYHRIDHLWRLPLLIHSLSNQYKYYLRPHGAAVLDLVCYAIPAK